MLDNSSGQPGVAGDVAEEEASLARDEGGRLSGPGNAALVATLGLAVAACGGGGEEEAADSAAPATTTAAPPTDAEAARFLLQAQFSASDEDISAVKTKGYSTWLNDELARADSGASWDWMIGRNYTLKDLRTAGGFVCDQIAWQQLLATPDPVRKRLSLALSEYFVVSANTEGFLWSAPAMAAYWDVLNANVFGNFRQLLEDVTLNPAMGYYLSTANNRKEDTKTGRQPDENYAREIMQLFTIGLHQLNNDGSEKKDSNGKSIETYSNSDVSNLARVFTGYSYDVSGELIQDPNNTATSLIPTMDSRRRKMTTDFNKWHPKGTSSQHSTLAKTFLGVTIPENTDAATSLKTALDTLFNHANLGPFFARQMIQRLVTSNPSAAYIDRVAKAFNNNGSGTRGDMKAVWRAILLDDEARKAAGLTDTKFGKLREPMLRLVQWSRSFAATSASGDWKIGNVSSGTNLGQSPLRAPSVFNFFRPGYVPPNGGIAAANLVAPEFQLVNETTTSGYVNYMTNAVRSGIASDVTAPYTKELAILGDATALVDRLSLILTANQLSSETRTSIRTAVDSLPLVSTSTDSQKLNRLSLAILLVMSSSEYLIQK